VSDVERFLTWQLEARAAFFCLRFLSALVGFDHAGEAPGRAASMDRALGTAADASSLPIRDWIDEKRMAAARG